ncbi:MAG: hypothetical protein PF542_01895 [Nanoarchaeota archaeon]|jgi:hypothetical protein|nr:hypothetical protein [Nanoarchaeota archaeon]
MEGFFRWAPEGPKFVAYYSQGNNVYDGINERKLNSKRNENVISCKNVVIDLDTIDIRECEKLEKN